MEQNSTSSRLHALDGLRGLAILLVFLSHLPTSLISSPNLLTETIFDSGVVGVSMLFILSGFLMAYLYPHPASKINFLQKRYTRIFPLFLTISLSLFLFRFLPLNWAARIALLVLLATAVHLLWTQGIRRLNKIASRILFFSFLGLQILVGGIYIYLVSHYSQNYYDNQLPFFIHESLVGLVNFTLTLPLGKYVFMMDPVYWSLAAEVLFYLLYPFVFAPLIGYISAKKRLVKISFLLSLIPLLFGVSLISNRILQLNLLRPYLFYYFIVGMALGYFYNLNAEKVISWGEKFKTSSLYIFLGSLVLIQILMNHFSLPWQEVVQMVFAIFFTLSLMISLNKNSVLSKLFVNKFLVFIGTISYSIYLSHMIFVHALSDTLGTPQNFVQLGLFIFGSFALTVIFSSLFYYLLERPYFTLKTKQKINNLAVFGYKNYGALVLGAICGAFLILTFFVYSNDYYFYTLEYPFSDWSVLISHSPTDIYFKGSADNLNGVVFRLDREFYGQITAKVKQNNTDSWLGVSDYKVTDKENPSFLLGIPPVARAKDQGYLLEVISNNLPVKILNLKSVYIVERKQLIRNPQSLLLFIENKAANGISNLEAQEVFLTSLPFLLISLYLPFSRNWKKIPT